MLNRWCGCSGNRDLVDLRFVDGWLSDGWVVGVEEVSFNKFFDGRGVWKERCIEKVVIIMFKILSFNGW